MRRLPALLLLLLFLAPPLRGPAAAPTGGEARERSGQLLVAEPDLADPNFARTVVLLLAHGPEGALGLVVNRPYGRVPAADLLRKLGKDPAGAKGQVELFYGGPVQPDLAAVVIGGSSLLGGRGSAIGTCFGVLIIAVLQAGLAQAGASEPTKRIVTGAAIVAAVALDGWRRRRGRHGIDA